SASSSLSSRSTRSEGGGSATVTYLCSQTYLYSEIRVYASAETHATRSRVASASSLSASSCATSARARSFARAARALFGSTVPGGACTNHGCMGGGDGVRRAHVCKEEYSRRSALS